MDSVGTYQKLTLAEAVSSASIYEDEVCLTNCPVTVYSNGQRQCSMLLVSIYNNCSDCVACMRRDSLTSSLAAVKLREQLCCAKWTGMCHWRTMWQLIKLARTS